MKVGIIGAGTMGSGIAQVFAQAEGYQVMLCDINDSFAAKGKNRILQSYQKRVKAGKMTEEQMETYLEPVSYTHLDVYKRQGRRCRRPW